jgi:hypothetical protein
LTPLRPSASQAVCWFTRWASISISSSVWLMAPAAVSSLPFFGWASAQKDWW